MSYVVNVGVPEQAVIPFRDLTVRVDPFTTVANKKSPDQVRLAAVGRVPACKVVPVVPKLVAY
jgi:hypothetical protein